MVYVSKIPKCIEAFRAVKLIQQIAANFKGSTFFVQGKLEKLMPFIFRLAANLLLELIRKFLQFYSFWHD